jgi:hypothetical protein
MRFTLPHAGRQRLEPLPGPLGAEASVRQDGSPDSRNDHAGSNGCLCRRKSASRTLEASEALLGNRSDGCGAFRVNFIRQSCP